MFLFNLDTHLNHFLPIRPIVSGIDMKRTYYSITAAIADSCPVLLNGEALSGKSFCFNFLASRLGRFSGTCP